MYLMVSTYGFKLKISDFYFKRAFLQGKNWNPFHSSDVKTKPYMFCVLWDNHLKFICVFRVSTCKQFLNILCKYSLIKRMEMRFSALKNNLFLKTCVSKKGFRRRHKERKLFTFKVTKLRANEIYHLGTEICNIWFFYKILSAF